MVLVRWFLLSGCIWGAVLIAPSVEAQERNPLRLWKDVSGKFQVRASLIEQGESTVKLRTEDSREISVPIDRLGAEERAYLRAVAAPSDNPFAGGQPAEPDASEPASGQASAPDRRAPVSDQPVGFRALPESSSRGANLALPATGNTVDLSDASATAGFQTDPQVSVPQFPAGSVSITTVDAYDKVSEPVLAEASDANVLLSVSRAKVNSPDETRGRIFVADLQKRTAALVWDQPQAVRVLDHDSATGRTLVVDGLDHFQRGGELAMVSRLGAGEPKVLYRRSLPGAGKPGFAPQVAWAKLLSGSHVAAIVDRVLYVWDLPSSELIYRIENVLDNAPPALSGRQRFMAVPQPGGAVLIEVATGAVCGKVPMEGVNHPGVDFHPNGRWIALCSGNQYLVWDCVDQSIVRQATTTEHLGTSPLDWVGENSFRCQLGALVHIELGMSIWKYSVSSATDPLMVGGKMLVATRSGQCELASLQLPHGPAEKVAQDLLEAGDSLMLVRPGTSVSVSVESTVDGIAADEIATALSTSIRRAGWQVSPDAPIRLVAQIGRGESKELKYRSMRGPTRSTSTATLHPFTAELEIRQNDEVLWERSTSNHVPMMLRLEEGETVQDAVKRYEKPDAKFFARLHLPPRIPKPQVSETIGFSVLRNGQWQDIDRSRLPSRPRSR